MTAGPPPGRDPVDVEALLADRYLDDLLAATDRRALDAPADASLDPGMREAARALRRVLVRVHPSFRFEERLAGRLLELAAAQGGPAVAIGGAPIVPLAVRSTSRVVPTDTAAAVDAPGMPPLADPLRGADPLLGAILAGDLDPADGTATDAASRLAGARRPLILGGAITSAALSLVGVAWVAWRASRSGSRPTPPGASAVTGSATGAGHVAGEVLAVAAGAITSHGIGGGA